MEKNFNIKNFTDITNTCENEQNTNITNTQKDTDIIKSDNNFTYDTFITKEEKYIKSEPKNSKIEVNSMSVKNNSDIKKDSMKRNTKASIMTITVQEQIKNKFSLDNKGQINLAEIHRSANRPLNKIKEFNKQTKFCQCCNLPCIQEGIIEPFKFCDNIKEFAVCGKGVYLYFFYIGFAVFSIFITILISSITFIIFSKNYYNHIINLCKGNNLDIIEKCDKYRDVKMHLVDAFWSYKFSINNIKIYRDLCIDLIGNDKICNKSIINYSIINFFSMISLFMFNIVFLYILYYINIKLKKGILPSDYTLLITNLNGFYIKFKNDKFHNDEENQFNIDRFILDLRQQLFESNKISDINKNIHSINLCYKINDYMKYQKKCEEYKYKIFQILYNPYQKKKNEKLKLKNNEKCYFLMPLSFFGCLFSIKKGDNLRTLIQKNQKNEEYLFKLMEQGKKLDKFAGSIFITFNTLKDKERYYNEFPHYFIEKVFYFIKNIKYYFVCNKKKREDFFLKKKINVFYANEPEDIIWENLEYSKRQRILRKLLIYLISILLLLSLFMIVYKLTSIQNDLNNRKDWKFITINIVSYSIALAIVIVNKIFQILIEYLTKFEKPYSFTHLYLSCSVKLTMFAFITSSFIPFISNYLKKNEKDNNLMTKNIANLFIINAISLPLPSILITYYFKIFRIWLVKRNPKGIYYTQKELNDLYELPDMCISYRYSEICQTLLMTFFYMPIFPFGAVISTIGLIITYFCQKLYFIHFYKRPEMLNESICKFYLEYFIFDLLIYAIGDYTFTKDIYDDKKWRLFNLIVFIIMSIIPYNKLVLLYLDTKKIFQIDSSIPISKVYFSFFNDYERQNPMTKKEGLLKYINTLREKKLISEKVKKIAAENVENINIMEVYYKSSLRHSIFKSNLAFVNNKNKFLKTNTDDNESYKGLNNYNNNVNEKKINHNQKIEKKPILEEQDLKEIIKNNNSFILCSYKNPILFGINDSIRLSIKDPVNFTLFSNNISNSNDNNNNVNMNKSDINKIPKYMINESIEKCPNKNNIIYEESKEEDIYNNISGINDFNKIKEAESIIKLESQEIHLELPAVNINNSNSRNNQLYKSLNFQNGSFNEYSSTSKIVNEMEQLPMERRTMDLNKSANFKKKKALNE